MAVRLGLVRPAALILEYRWQSPTPIYLTPSYCCSKVCWVLVLHRMSSMSKEQKGITKKLSVPYFVRHNNIRTAEYEILHGIYMYSEYSGGVRKATYMPTTATETLARRASGQRKPRPATKRLIPKRPALTSRKAVHLGDQDGAVPLWKERKHTLARTS